MLKATVYCTFIDIRLEDPHATQKLFQHDDFNFRLITIRWLVVYFGADPYYDLDFRHQILAGHYKV